VAGTRRNASVFDAVNGVVKYDWVAGDTETAGDFECEFEVTEADGALRTFPNDGYKLFKVLDHVA
jgi:hypothetical protein